VRVSETRCVFRALGAEIVGEAFGSVSSTYLLRMFGFRKAVEGPWRANELPVLLSCLVSNFVSGIFLSYLQFKFVFSTPTEGGWRWIPHPRSRGGVKCPVMVTHVGLNLNND